MKKPTIIKYLICLAVIAGTSACTDTAVQNLSRTATVLSKSPTPNYVSGTRNNTFGSAICVEISQESLWRPGDDISGLSKRITESTKVVVDYSEVSTSITQFNSISPVYVEGKLVAVVGGPIEICFSSKSLNAGFHLAKISFSTASGNSYTFYHSFDLK